MNVDTLDTARLLLRPISIKHLSQDYVDWLNDPDVNRYLESGGDYTLYKLEKYLEDMQNKGILFWGIHLVKNGIHIGNIKVDPINARHGLGEYGIMIGRKSEWGNGYAEEATRKVIQYCFEVVGLRKITLGVVSENSHAVELYERMGFVVEGKYTKHGLYSGKYCDVLRMALFNPSFNFNV
jgi:RimJ/RimL family protein N-acetyltransferase